jgi:hypothetical protein
MKINTELCCKRYDFLTKKTQNFRYCNYCPGWQEFKSIHMIFYVNPSWACALFINNKQHVGGERSTRGRKRTSTDSELKRNRSEVSSKWNKCRIYVGDQLDRCRWMERTEGSVTRQITRWSGKDFAWLLLIGKPSMLPSFLNRFSYFMNLWWSFFYSNLLDFR